jgi:hypothetical protein
MGFQRPCLVSIAMYPGILGGVYDDPSENLFLAKLGLPLIERPRDYPRRIKHVQ